MNLLSLSKEARVSFYVAILSFLSSMVRKSVPNSPLQWLLLPSGERVASELVPVTSGFLESMMVPIPSS